MFLRGVTLISARRNGKSRIRPRVPSLFALGREAVLQSVLEKIRLLLSKKFLFMKEGIFPSARRCALLIWGTPTTQISQRRHFILSEKCREAQTGNLRSGYFLRKKTRPRSASGFFRSFLLIVRMTARLSP